jgi:hypothetical protein
VSQGEESLNIDIDQLLRESALAAAEFDSTEINESKRCDGSLDFQQNSKMLMMPNIANSALRR